MARGGKRENAGRPVGAIAAVNREARAKALESGESPLDYMLRVMRDETSEPERRDRMAQGAAPYVHAKLASLEHSGKDGGPLSVQIIRFSEEGDSTSA